MNDQIQNGFGGEHSGSGGAQPKQWGLNRPPQMEVGDEYNTWRSDIVLWNEVTDVPVEKRAILVKIGLNGKMKRATSKLGKDILVKNDGLDKLLEKLDELFLEDQGIRQFNAYFNIHQYRRSANTSIQDFIVQFEYMYFKLSSESIEVPDIVKAFCLLVGCNLEMQDRNMIMAGLQKITYDNMKAKIQQVFGNRVGVKDTKIEKPTHDNSDKTNDVLYSENRYYPRGRGYPRGNPAWRGKSYGNSQNGYENTQQVRSARGSRGNRGKPRYTRAKSGNPFAGNMKTKCYGCNSHEHWWAQCPGNTEGNKSMYANGYDDEEEDEDDYVMFTLSDTVEPNVTMFVGCTGESVLAHSLVDDSKGCGILDSGCTKTVCGERWLTDYLDNLSDYEKSMVKEESSPATFTFGDGITVKSRKKLTLPCMIGGVKGKVVTDVVQCDIPLLLSKKSMKSVGMILNFKEDTVKIGSRTIKLHSTTSGHYALPLCL